MTNSRSEDRMTFKNDWTRFVVRMPPLLAESLRKRAASKRKSLNSEIVEILEDGLRNETLNRFTVNAKTSAAEIVIKMQQLASQLADLNNTNNLLKNEFLNSEEKEVLQWFSNAQPEDRSLLIASFPEILALLKKMR